MLYSYGLPCMYADEMGGCTLSPSSRSMLAFKTPSSHRLQENIFQYISKAIQAQPLANNMSQCHLFWVKEPKLSYKLQILKNISTLLTNKVGEKRKKNTYLLYHEALNLYSNCEIQRSKIRDSDLRVGLIRLNCEHALDFFL